MIFVKVSKQYSPFISRKSTVNPQTSDAHQCSSFNFSATCFPATLSSLPFTFNTNQCCMLSDKKKYVNLKIMTK